ncbi:hypothetical protein [Sphingomonas sp.]|uniref:hypothetical protein n=1 Tax=Sphingomonas sp. TaxID=28214 RepID=UPI001AFFDF64|nr:hypothetical protein [Sphingomonas sp.]MBO9714130.1 hypothetical protein [Sphingomonas sp.]
MILRVAMGLGLALASLPANAKSADTLTLEEARAMSVPQLARRVLGVVGASIREARIDSGDAVGHPGVLSRILLARAPEHSLWGMCKADVFIVNFDPADPKRSGANTPTVASQVWRNSWYKVIGKVEPSPDRNLPDPTVQDAACAAAVPVLWQDDFDRETGYFSGSFRGRHDLHPEEAWFVARVLRAAQSWPGAIECREHGKAPAGWLCDGPRKPLKGHELTEDGSVIEVDACRDEPQTYCVSLGFSEVPGDHDAQRYIMMTVATAASTSLNADPIVVRSVRLEGIGSGD